MESVTFSIARGETLGLVGESGSGKSTVARMLLGLVRPDSGAILFEGIPVFDGGRTASGSDMRGIRRRMQPVFQDPFAALNPRMRVGEIVIEPLRIFRNDEGVDASPTGLRRQASELMRSVGLDESALAPLSARVFRRAAAADQYCSGAGAAPGTPGARRAGFSARCERGRPSREPAARFAARISSDLPVYLPFHAAGAVSIHQYRGNAKGTPCRNRRMRGYLSQSR